MRSNIQERSKSTLKKTTYPVQKAINENKIKQNQAILEACKRW